MIRDRFGGGDLQRGDGDGNRGGDGRQPPINRRTFVSLSPINSGDGGKILGGEHPKFGAEGAVLENFSDFSGKLLLKNAIKSEDSGI